jgi:hypothetical protein
MRSASGGRSWIVVGLTAIVQTGCFAAINEEYFLAAYDRESGAANYYRIDVDGISAFSASKFSKGFYDRGAVERLFAEHSLEHEYLSQKVDAYGADAKRIQDLSSELNRARTGILSARVDELVNLTGTLSELLGRYEVRLLGQPDAFALYQGSLARARAAISEAEVALRTLPAPPTASQLSLPLSKLQEAQGYLRSVSLAMDGRTLVRFFDGGGNEIDFGSKSIVFFASANSAPFAEAIRQLTDEQSAQQDILMALLGPRIQEARALAQRAGASDAEEAALGTRLDEIAAKVPGASSIAELTQHLRDATSALAGGGRRFQTGGEIESYLRGQEAAR